MDGWWSTGDIHLQYLYNIYLYRMQLNQCRAIDAVHCIASFHLYQNPLQNLKSTYPISISSHQISTSKQLLLVCSLNPYYIYSLFFHISSSIYHHNLPFASNNPLHYTSTSIHQQQQNISLSSSSAYLHQHHLYPVLNFVSAMPFINSVPLRLLSTNKSSTLAINRLRPSTFLTPRLRLIRLVPPHPTCSPCLMRLATDGDSVNVHYTGFLDDGTQFDTSRGGKEPLNFVVGAGAVIRGFDDVSLLPSPLYFSTLVQTNPS